MKRFTSGGFLTVAHAHTPGPVLRPTAQPPQIGLFRNDEERWQAILNRDPAAEGLLLYSVKTTGVYCRPTCPARLPLRKNVQFHSSCQAAEAAGFRPCRRCRPDETSLQERHAAVAAQVCRLIEGSETMLSLEELSATVGVSPYHLHRLFKAQTGLTPRKYAAACRNDRTRQQLAQCTTVTEAIYRAGFNSSGRFYESATEMLGMTPTEYQIGGQATRIQFAIASCWLGIVLIAATVKGICAVLLGDDPQLLVEDLEARFPKAELFRGDGEFDQVVSTVIEFVTSPTQNQSLPLDIRGTAFQHRVWEALRQIPPGATATYTDIAHRIGQPSAVRAVAHACAANALAVIIPCHRVVRSDGTLSGYRWGIERKSKLLLREQESQSSSGVEESLP